MADPGLSVLPQSGSAMADLASRYCFPPALKRFAMRPLACLLLGIAWLGLPIAVPVQAQTAPARSDIAHFTLKNGLEVVVIPDHRTPVVTHMMWYRVGSADETPGKSGLAHFLEHLMFKGTRAHPAGEFSKTVARIGGNENAFTSTDYTAYFQRVPRDKLSQMMELEADRMTGLVLSDANVLPERDVVLEEFNQRIANSPDARLSQQMMAALYLNHPYGRPVIGWHEEIKHLNREDALAFYKRFYAPNNAILIVAGDVTETDIRKLAETHYARIPANPAIARERERPGEPVPEAPRKVTLADPRVTQPSVRRLYLVPSTSRAKSGESEALEVLAHVIGSGANSQLYQELVVKQGIAVSTAAWYSGSGLDSTQLGISVTPKPGVTLDTTETAIDAVLAHVITNGIDEDALARAKTQLVAAAIYAQDSQTSLARWYGVALTTGSRVEDVAAWPERIRKVSADQVKAAAQAWLDARRSVTGYLVKDLAPVAPKREDKRS